MKMIDRACVDAVQSALQAPRVDVFVVGRDELATRPGLMFIADEARALGRAGFALGEAAERYVIQGGLEEAELDALFRAAAGKRTEHDVRAGTRQWVAGETVVNSSRLPPVVRKELALPLSVSSLTKIAQALQSGAVRAYGEVAGARVRSVGGGQTLATGGRGL